MRTRPFSRPTMNLPALKALRLSLLLVLLLVAISNAAKTGENSKGLAKANSVGVKAQRFGRFQNLFNGGGFDEDEDEYEYDEDEDEEEDDDDVSDCDNGNDDDDGSEWHTLDFPRIQKRPNKMHTLRGIVPFPQWLADITGLNAWPDANPPYIPQPHINLNNIPVVPFRGLGNCTGVDPSHCSFDCYRCTTPDDIFTCPLLSQTFDDGPGPATPKLLENLPGKTTFFTQGINVIRFPETFRLQHAQGHLLASHTWSHANLAGIPNEAIAAQIQWSIWAMNATAGIIPRYFRPPYGASDNRVRAISRQFGLVSVFWDRDTFDWLVNDKKKTPEKVYSDVMQWKRELPNGLILEHDSTIDVVNVGIQVARILNSERQMTVADCINAQWYQNIPPV